MDFQPTPEQAAIVSACRETSDNIIIHALAGAAKTSTLVLIAKALPSVPMMCLAFNVRIKKELGERLPGNCETLTLNGLGHRVWGRFLGRRLVVDKDKVYKIVSGLVDKLEPDEKREAFESFTTVMNAVRFGKTSGYIPTGKHPHAKPLVQDDEFFASLDEEPTALEERLIRQATIASLDLSFRGEIDYDDQILMPACFPAEFPAPPLVLGDEGQDFSELNHRMLSKLVKKRLIVVGDECQSIYAFRGAHQNSMQLLEQQFNMKRFTLSISFRCPKRVVEASWWRAPHMRWPDWAIDGEVTKLDRWGAEALPTDAVILCRNNAPLFACAIKLLKNGRYPELVGNDIGKNLIKIMGKLGPKTLSRDESHVALDEWVSGRLTKTRDPAKVHDQAECIRVFLSETSSLGDAIAYAEHMFSIAGPVKLMTGHKAKGLEWDNVFILDEHLIGKEHPQERNLRYVMITRAKRTLTYIQLERFEGV